MATGTRFIIAVSTMNAPGDSMTVLPSSLLGRAVRPSNVMISRGFHGESPRARRDGGERKDAVYVSPGDRAHLNYAHGGITHRLESALLSNYTR